VTAPSGLTLAGTLEVFAKFERDFLRDRGKTGIDQARKVGCFHPCPSLEDVRS